MSAHRPLSIILSCVFASGLLAQSQSSAVPAQRTGRVAGFDVASIHESKDGQSSFIENPPHNSLFIAQRLPVQALVMAAYGIHFFHLLTIEPAWTRQTRYDLEAKSDEAEDKVLAGMSNDEAYDEKRRMLRQLLAERFHLRIHQEARMSNVYDLVATKAANTLMVAAAESPDDANHNQDYPSSCGKEEYSRAGVELIATSCSMKSLVSYLKAGLGTEVIDRTGMTGRHAFRLKWGVSQPRVAENDAAFPPMLQALPEQTGLKLVPAKGPVNIWVVDHVEPPTPN